MAGSCFWNSEFEDQWQHVDDNLEINPFFYEYFCNFEARKCCRLHTDPKNLICLNHAEIRNPKDFKLFILLSLCKNFAIGELHIKKEYENIHYLLDKIITRNPALKSIHLEFQKSRFFNKDVFPVSSRDSKDRCFSSRETSNYKQIPFVFPNNNNNNNKFI